MSAQPGAHGDLWRKSQYSENSQTRISCPKSQGCDSAETQLYNWICQKPVTLNAQLPRRRCCFRPSPTRLLRLPEPWLFWPLFVCLFTCFLVFPHGFSPVTQNGAQRSGGGGGRNKEPLLLPIACGTRATLHHGFWVLCVFYVRRRHLPGSQVGQRV